MKELKKYLLRYGSAGVVLVAISLLLSGILYGVFFKLILAIILAEIVWSFWFKPFIGSIDGETDNIRFLSKCIFRAIFVSSCILGACIGL